MDQLLYDAADVAVILRISRSHVYQLIEAGEFPVIRLGKSIRIPADGLRAWIERRATAPAVPMIDEAQTVRA